MMTSLKQQALRIAVVSIVLLAPAGVWAEGGQRSGLVIEIDGLNGAVLTPPARVARPGEYVTVRVVCADLFDYEYKIEETERTELVEQIPVVGGGVVVSKLTGEGVRAAGEVSATANYCELDDLSDADLATDVMVLRADFLKDATDAEPKLDDVRAKAAGFRQAWVPALRTVAQCSDWPTTLDTAITGLGGLEQTVNSLEAEQRNLATLITLAKFWQALPAATRAEYKRQAECTPTSGPGTGDGPPSAAGLTGLEVEVNRLKTDLGALRGNVDEASRIAAFWGEVKSRFPKPVIEQRFLMDQVSRRYTVRVQRKPISAAAKASETADDKGNPQFVTLASVAYEGHALARFNFTMGLVGVERPDERSFAIAPRVEEDDSISYHVIESESSDLDVDGALFVGVYLRKGGVDPFARDRFADPMLMLGTEFNVSPDTFYLGLGLDFKSGFVLGGGITQYRRTSLAEGWHPGLEVPAKADGSAKVATPPTVKDDDFGYYALIGFRPAVFRLWWAARKS
jgi:hypothetical protein